MLNITLKNKKTGGVKYTSTQHVKGSTPGSVALVSLADHGIVVSFANKDELNKFIKNNGNDEFSIHKMLGDRKYYTWGVYLVDCGNGRFVAKANIQESYDGKVVDVFIGPVAFSFDAAAKAFWTAWNKGNHPFKKDDGSPATLVRIANQPYLYGEPPIPEYLVK
jgi:hypothetical protein